VATTAPLRQDPLPTREQAPATARKRQPVEWFAMLGVLWLVFWAYVLIKWVTGPYFTNVPGGPDELPSWMNTLFVAWQAAAIPAVSIVGYFLIVRPWRRTGRVPVDGLLWVTFITMSLQDAGSNFFGYWYTINSHLVNMGSFINEIPGWIAFGEPGAQTPYAVLFHLMEYPFAFFAGILSGTWAMKFARRRWNLGPVGLCAFCFPFMMLFDLVAEGFFTLTGFYTMAGGHLSFFPEAYNKFPFIETVFIATLLTPLVALRFFRNDKGETLVERGADQLRMSAGKRDLVRLLALIGIGQTIYLVCYNIPISAYMGAKPGIWPRDVQERSYFNDHLCGPGSNRLCPGPTIPLTQKTWIAPGATGVGGPFGELNATGAGKLARERQNPPRDLSDPKPFVGRFIGLRSR
jgi:hypothetical protein